MVGRPPASAATAAAAAPPVLRNRLVLPPICVRLTLVAVAPELWHFGLAAASRHQPRFRGAIQVRATSHFVPGINVLIIYWHLNQVLERWSSNWLSADGFSSELLNIRIKPIKTIYRTAFCPKV